MHVLNWRELKSVTAASKVTWQLLYKYSPSLHFGDLQSPAKSLEGEQSTVLAFYTGVQHAHVGVVFLAGGGLYNKVRLDFVCQAMRMHKQIKTRCRVYTYL